MDEDSFAYIDMFGPVVLRYVVDQGDKQSMLKVVIMETSSSTNDVSSLGTKCKIQKSIQDLSQSHRSIQKVTSETFRTALYDLLQQPE
jgi:hypothetical protein